MNGNRPVLSRRGFRLAVLIAAGVCLLAIAAGAFGFSYPGVRDTALAAGVSPRVARFYPLLFDAVLILACAAAVTLRGALRGYAWLAILVIIGAVATADTVHAMSITAPKRPLEATIAIAPWVVLLGGLTLLDAMIRQKAPGPRAAATTPVSANGRAPAAAPADPVTAQPAGASVVPLSALLHDRPRTSALGAKAPVSPPAAGASLARATASPGAVGPGPSEATAGPSEATAGPSGVTAGPSGATAGPSGATAGPSGATAGPSEATAGPSGATAGPSAATAGPSEATAGPSGVTADPREATADPSGADPGRPTAAGSPARVPQTPPEPGAGRSPGD